MSTPTQEDSGVSNVKPEGVLGGKPRLAGHRISGLDVTELLEAGYPISGAADQLDITVEEVGAAKRLYRHQRDELAEFARRRRETHPALQGSGEDTTSDRVWTLCERQVRPKPPSGWPSWQHQIFQHK